MISGVVHAEAVINHNLPPSRAQLAPPSSEKVSSDAPAAYARLVRPVSAMGQTSAGAAEDKEVVSLQMGKFGIRGTANRDLVFIQSHNDFSVKNGFRSALLETGLSR